MKFDAMIKCTKVCPEWLVLKICNILLLLDHQDEYTWYLILIRQLFHTDSFLKSFQWWKSTAQNWKYVELCYIFVIANCTNYVHLNFMNYNKSIRSLCGGWQLCPNRLFCRKDQETYQNKRNWCRKKKLILSF